jgi:AbrB family looped-hinge helix DNA binding protein
MAEATLSSKYQIVIPSEVRKKLGLKSGDKLIITTAFDKMIVLEKPKSYSAAIRALPPTKYPADYLKKERED